MDTGEEQVSQQAAESSSEELKPGLYVARVIVHYEKLLVPDSCPNCGAAFAAGEGTLNLREVNLGPLDSDDIEWLIKHKQVWLP